MNEEIRAKIASLKTEHPGGYEDIINALRAANRDLKQPNGLKVHTGDIISDIERAAQQEDSAAFEVYMTAARLPKDTPEQQSARDEALQKAALETIRVPLGVSRAAGMGAEPGRTNPKAS